MFGWIEDTYGWSGKTWKDSFEPEPLVYTSGGEYPPSDQTKERLRTKNRKTKKVQKRARKAQR